MKRALTLAIGLCWMTILPQLVFSQGGFDWRRGLYLSPDLTYRHLTEDGTNPTSTALVAQRNATEKPSLGYSVGLSASRSNPFWNFEFGTQYGSRGFSSTITYTQPRPDNATSLHTRVTAAIFEFPIRVDRFFTLSAKTKLMAGAGISPGLITSLKEFYRTEYSDRDPYFEQNRRIASPGFQLGTSLRIGTEVNIAGTQLLRIAPTFQYYWGMPQLLSSQTENWWAAGLQIGIYFTPKGI